MQPLREVDGTTAPGPDESWQELADHSVTTDDLDHPRTPRPLPDDAPRVI